MIRIKRSGDSLLPYWSTVCVVLNVNQPLGRLPEIDLASRHFFGGKIENYDKCKYLRSYFFIAWAIFLALCLNRMLYSQGDWLTKEYNRLNEERKRAGEAVNPEPTFDEILKQERMPQNLEGYIDPIKMWVKYDGESKVPGALADFP